MRTAFSLAATLTILALPAFADEDVRHPFTASLPHASVRRVVVDIPAGDITIRNGNGRTIEMSGEARRDFSESGDRATQQQMINDVSAVITVSGDEAVIERKFGPNSGGWASRSFRTEFRLEVSVPTDVDVELTTHYGDVSIEGEFGDVNVDLRAGEIHLRTPHDAVRDLTASVRVGEVHADFGDERINNEGVFPGSTHFHNSNGRRSHISLHTTAGEVHVMLTR